MKSNAIVALLVGLVVGFAAGKMVGGPGGASPVAAVVADETTLAIKSGEMPGGTFTDMTEAQKFAVMKVMNDNNCDCGCGLGSYAACVKGDPNCPKSPAMLKRAVGLAKEGKSAEQIQTELFGAKKGAAAAKPRQAAADDSTVYKVGIDGSPVLGNSEALVTIVEFSDYQCPYCSRAHATVKEVLSAYGSKVRLVMRQNPLDMHPQARPAALAALAAGEQGKFWELHDKMFENQRALDNDSLERYAKDVGLDVAKWKTAMASPKLKEIIAADQGAANSLGASGTPAFFVNGHKMSGAQPLDAFKTVIDAQLAKAEALVKAGTPATQVYAKIMESGVTGPPAAPERAAPPSVRNIPVPADAPFTGPKSAKVTIVLFSDFECPFCSRAVPVIKKIEEAYPKDVKLVFRQFPLAMHAHAELAAQASLAAHEQGKFWQMHDKLFENQRALDRDSLDRYAQEIGLDVAKFKAALDTKKFADKVKTELSGGMAASVNGTPTFFVNGREQVGAPSFETFKSMIDQEITAANALLAAGTKIEGVYEARLAQASQAAPPPTAEPIQNIQVGAAPVNGPASAPVTIVAFSDFQCPFCSRAVPTLKALEEKYKGQIRVAFKNQPLAMHSNARIAAAAGLAAHEQGKFWAMHDKMFANQGSLDRASLEGYAQELGLDVNKFKAALDSNKFERQIKDDSEEGNRVGAQGTPTFFINGRQIVGAAPIDDFSRIIDDELAKAKAKPAPGKGAVPAKAAVPPKK